jgi:hypothetical protein
MADDEGAELQCLKLGVLASRGSCPTAEVTPTARATLTSSADTSESTSLATAATGLATGLAIGSGGRTPGRDIPGIPGI